MASAGNEHHQAKLGNVHDILRDLKDDVADLQDKIKEQSSTFFKRFADDLTDVDDVMNGLSETMISAAHGLKHRDGDSIPAVIIVSETTTNPDLGKVCRDISDGVAEAKMAYHNFALQAKDLVNDADKMDIVVKACQTEFIKLKLTTNNAKARLNAHRLGWGRLGYAFRQWAEMVHFATIECIRREMEQVEADRLAWLAANGGALAAAQAEFDKLIGAQRRIKMELMLKRMKNARIAAAWSTWDELVREAKFAAMEAARLQMMADLEARYGHLNAEAVEAKIRQFLLRWINRKIMPAFKTWKDIWVKMVQNRDASALEAELAAMRAKLAMMGDNAALAKLKMHFAKKLGQMKSMCWKALAVHAHQQKALKLLESEAGARLKAFLQGKLETLGRKCWNAWLKHHQNIAEENMKNNENAKKIAIMLEKIARSLVNRQFHAFIRLHKINEEEREAQRRIMERLAMMDELNKAKLRVFLDAKRLGKMSGFFKWWSDVTANGALYALQDQIDAEDKAIAELKASIGECEDLLGGHAANAHGMRAELMNLEKSIKSKEVRVRDLEGQLAGVNKKVKDTEAWAKEEQDERQETLAEIKALERDIDKMYASRDGLANELAGIAGEIGYVHKDSQF